MALTKKGTPGLVPGASPFPKGETRIRIIRRTVARDVRGDARTREIGTLIDVTLKEAQTLVGMGKAVIETTRTVETPTEAPVVKKVNERVKKAKKGFFGVG